MNPNTKPAQIPHNVHYSSAKVDSAPRLPIRHATADTGFKLVEAVGIEPTTFGLKGRCSTTELRPWSAIVSVARRCRNRERNRIGAQEPRNSDQRLRAWPLTLPLIVFAKDGHVLLDLCL